MPGVRVAVIGDLMLDVLVAPAQTLRAGDDVPGRIELESGGQAANVAAWVAALGGQARLVCARARDLSGERAAARLADLGVEVVGPSVSGSGGVVVSIIEPDGQRSLVSDPGSVSRSLRRSQLEEEWFEGCAWLHVSGYHLFDDDAIDAALRAGELARAGGARVSLDLAYAARLRELGPAEALRRLGALAPDLVFATAEEAGALDGPAPATACVVKQGAEGCTVIAGGERLSLPAAGAVAVDTTGAGDAFAAGMLVADPDDLVAAARRGLSAAAICVGRFGAMPGDPVGAQAR